MRTFMSLCHTHRDGRTLMSGCCPPFASPPPHPAHTSPLLLSPPHLPPPLLPPLTAPPPRPPPR